jgi:hypothetical protein
VSPAHAVKLATANENILANDPATVQNLISAHTPAGDFQCLHRAARAPYFLLHGSKPPRLGRDWLRRERQFGLRVPLGIVVLIGTGARDRRIEHGPLDLVTPHDPPVRDVSPEQL